MSGETRWRSARRLAAALAAAAVMVGAVRADAPRSVAVFLGAGSPPYSFADDSGAAAGYSVDLVRAVAEHLGMTMHIRLVPRSEVVPALLTNPGSLGIAAISPEHSQRLDYSTPHAALNGRVFAGSEHPSINDIGELSGQSVAVVQGSYLYALLRDRWPSIQRVLFPDYHQALSALQQGELGYALLVDQAARYELMHDRGLSGIRATGPTTGITLLAFATARGDDTLLLEVDRATRALRDEGAITALEKQWLAPLTSASLDPKQVIYWVAVTLIPLCVLGGVGWVVALRRAVARRSALLAGRSAELQTTVDALELANARQRMAARCAGIAICDYDLASGKVLCNPEFHALSGIPADCPDIQIRWLRDCLVPESRPVFEDMLLRVRKGMADGQARLLTIRRAHDGAVRHILAFGEALRDANDAANRLLLVKIDVTELHEARALAQRRADDLARSNATLVQTQRQLYNAERMAALGQLAAGVAHEINNPLAFVKSNLGTLGEYMADISRVLDAYAADPTGDRAQQLRRQLDLDASLQDTTHLLDESREGLMRIERIVSDLRTFARPGEADAHWTDLHAGIDSTINICWNQIKYTAELVREYDPELPPVFCVGSQINQIILNLLVNAAQAMTSQGRITVRTGHTDDSVWIEVCDTGNGIPADVLPRVFDPFFTTKPVGQGTGLGLSLAQGIALRHGGTLEAFSPAGEGTRMRLTLPIECPVGAAEQVA